MHEETLAYLDGLERFGIHFGLERIRALVEALGHPERAYRTIHVVGTNGKTSTARFLSAILREHGYTVGTYVSPHLVGPAERQLVNDRPATEEEFLELADFVRSIAERIDAERPDDDHITQFEFLTAVAFEYFRRAGCDVAVVEAGLGGRLDATSVITSDVQVLTGIGLEHTRYLGDSLVQILEEKAAIIPPGGRVMAGALEEELKQRLRSICTERKASLHFAEEEVSMFADTASASFDVIGLFDSYGDLRLRALGAYQRHNAAVALGAAELFREGPLDEQAVRRALATTTVPGRLEMVSEKPLCLLDGAHNPQGIYTLMRTLDEAFPRRRVIAVVSILGDKDVPAMLAELVPRCDIFFATRCSNERALEADALAGLAESLLAAHDRRPTVFVDEDPCSALHSAYQLASSNQIVLVTGSLYLVGDLKRSLCL